MNVPRIIDAARRLVDLLENDAAVFSQDVVDACDEVREALSVTGIIERDGGLFSPSELSDLADVVPRGVRLRLHVIGETI